MPTAEAYSSVGATLPPSLGYGDHTLEEGAIEHTVQARDGRTLAVVTRGPDYGVPVFSYVGNPGSRFGPHLFDANLSEYLDEEGILLVSYDRPGFGGSTRKPGRSIGDSASDTEDIADYLGIGRFGILARSGGGPHGVGAAALLGERVSAMVLLAGVSPPESGLDLTIDSTEDNNQKFLAARQDPEALLQDTCAHAVALDVDPYNLVSRLYPDMRASDLVLFVNCHALSNVAFGHAMGIAHGYGWYDEIVAIQKPWIVNLADITAPTVVWGGVDDSLVSVEHARWLSKNIPNATLLEDPSGSHFSTLLVASSALKWIRRHHIGEDRERSFEERLARELQAYYPLDSNGLSVRATDEQLALSLCAVGDPSVGDINHSDVVTILSRVLRRHNFSASVMKSILLEQG